MENLPGFSILQTYCILWGVVVWWAYSSCRMGLTAPRVEGSKPSLSSFLFLNLILILLSIPALARRKVYESEPKQRDAIEKGGSGETKIRTKRWDGRGRKTGRRFRNDEKYETKEDGSERRTSLIKWSTPSIIWRMWREEKILQDSHRIQNTKFRTPNAMNNYNDNILQLKKKKLIAYLYAALIIFMSHLKINCCNPVKQVITHVVFI